jgi:hypothetical protein
VILVRPCSRTLFPSLPFDSFAGSQKRAPFVSSIPAQRCSFPAWPRAQERRSGRVSPGPVACSPEFLHTLGQQGAGRVGLRPLPLCPATVAAQSHEQAVHVSSLPVFSLQIRFCFDFLCVEWLLCGMVAGEAPILLLSYRIENLEVL